MGLKHDNRLFHLGIFSAAVLVSVSVGYVFSPVSKTSAETVKVKTDVETSISLNLDKSELTLNGNANTFTYGYATASVSTNSSYGYTLAMEDADASTDLVSAISDDKFTSDYSGSKTQETMEDDSWGFSLNEEDFYKIPRKNSPVALKKVLTYLDVEVDSVTVSIGAKIGPDIEPGQYQDQLLFTAYTNGVDGSPEGLDPSSSDPEDISFDFPEPYEEGEGIYENRLVLAKSMQDPKLKSYCAATYTPTMNSASAAFTKYFSGDKTPKAIVKDKRDGNKYEIAKLADGRCWMTQNIAIINITITPELSDIENNYTLPQSNFNALAYTPVTYNAAYVHEDPDRGGYYNWMTATAGTGPRESGNYANATASICPKGWRLPSGGSNGEFKALGDAYNQSGLKLIDVPAFSTDGYISSLAHGYSGGGLYWSYMSNGEWGAYTMMTTSSGGLYTTEGTAKNVGAHVRCILRTE